MDLRESCTIQAACMIGKMSIRAAVTVKDTVQKKIEEERQKKNTPQSSPKEVKTAQVFEKALNETDHGGQPRLKRSEHYISDSSTTMSHER